MNKRSSLMILVALTIWIFNFFSISQVKAATTLAFDVTLSSNPPATGPVNGDQTLYAHVGDVITFNHHITQSGVVDKSWTRYHDRSKLDCAAYSLPDSVDFRCKVISKGTSHVSITFYPIMSDGTKRTITSNLIYVIAEDECQAGYLKTITITGAKECQPPATTTMCMNSVTAQNGKFNFELLGRDGKRNADCRFTKYNYDVLSGSAKLLSMNEYVLTFDNNLSGKIRVNISEPSPHWAEFVIGAQSTSPSISAEYNDQNDPNVSDETEIDSEDLPDLAIAVQRITLVRLKLVSGGYKNAYKVYLMISNKGEGDAEGVIHYSSGKAGTPGSNVLLSKSGLAAGKSVQRFVYIDAKDKNSTYLFTVDSLNSVDESDETNNAVKAVIKK